MIPRDPAEIEAIAAEYVLGTLDGQREEVRRILEQGVDPGSDPADIDAALHLQHEIAWWERQLAGLALSIPAVQPPAELWRSIEMRARTPANPAVIPFPVKRPTPWESLAVWRFVAGAAIAACLALLVWSGTDTASPAGALALLTPAGGPTQAAGFFLVERQGSRLRVTALEASAVPPGRDLELWSLRGGKPAPLGLVRSASYLAPAPLAIPGIVPSGTDVAISLEPAGGSASGQPTGPVLYVGKLTDIARS